MLRVVEDDVMGWMIPGNGLDLDMVMDTGDGLSACVTWV
jgi:hypothetical protein